MLISKSELLRKIQTGSTVTDEVVALQPVVVSVKVKVAVPVETPVTTPAFVTVATEALLLSQVPPVVGDRVIVPPTDTDDGAETAGKGFIVAVTAVLEAVVPHTLVAST